MKQGLFHGAVVEDIAAEPLPPPHPELTKYFEPPKKVFKRANEAIDQCRAAFVIKKGLIWINQGIKHSHFALQSQRESHDHEKKITRALKTTTMKSFFLIV
jgi:ATP-dependent DNA helicase 2 subunit 2